MGFCYLPVSLKTACSRKLSVRVIMKYNAPLRDWSWCEIPWVSQAKRGEHCRHPFLVLSTRTRPPDKNEEHKAAFDRKTRKVGHRANNRTSDTDQPERIYSSVTCSINSYCVWCFGPWTNVRPRRGKSLYAHQQRWRR